MAQTIRRRAIEARRGKHSIGSRAGSVGSSGEGDVSDGEWSQDQRPVMSELPVADEVVAQSVGDKTVLRVQYTYSAARHP